MTKTRKNVNQNQTCFILKYETPDEEAIRRAEEAALAKRQTRIFLREKRESIEYHKGRIKTLEKELKRGKALLKTIDPEIENLRAEREMARYAADFKSYNEISKRMSVRFDYYQKVEMFCRYREKSINEITGLINDLQKAKNVSDRKIIEKKYHNYF